MDPKSKDILIIDDDELVRAQLRAFLEQEGYSVREAGDGNEGLTLASLKLPAIVITDILMPDKEGIETIIQLRRHYPRARIIAISGGGRGDNVDFLRMAALFGAAHTLAKPFRPSDLLNAIRHLMDNDGKKSPDS